MRPPAQICLILARLIRPFSSSSFCVDRTAVDTLRTWAFWARRADFLRPLRGISISSLLALYSHDWALLKRILAKFIIAFYLNKALFVTLSLWTNISFNHTTCTIQELMKGLLTGAFVSRSLFFPASFRYSSFHEPRLTKTLHKLLTRRLIAREKRWCALNPTYFNSIEV